MTALMSWLLFGNSEEAGYFENREVVLRENVDDGLVVKVVLLIHPEILDIGGGDDAILDANCYGQLILLSTRLWFFYCDFSSDFVIISRGIDIIKRVCRTPSRRYVIRFIRADSRAL